MHTQVYAFTSKIYHMRARQWNQFINTLICGDFNGFNEVVKRWDSFDMGDRFIMYNL